MARKYTMTPAHKEWHKEGPTFEQAKARATRTLTSEVEKTRREVEKALGPRPHSLTARIKKTKSELGRIFKGGGGEGWWVKDEKGHFQGSKPR